MKVAAKQFGSTERCAETLRRDVFVAVSLTMLILIPYLQTVWFDFVNFDDPAYVYENPLVKDGLCFEAAYNAVFGFHQANWHPLVWLSYMVEIELAGMKPGVMHVTNVSLHIANSLLLYFWLRRSTGDAFRSYLAGLIFAIHPMHVESVAWITERKDVLSTLFLLATLFAYSAYVRKRSRCWYLGAVMLFCLGLTAKGMLVTLPALLLLLDFWPLKRFELHDALRFDRATLRGLLIDKIPFVVLSTAVAVITILAQRSGGAVAGMTAISLDGRIANSVVSFSRYILKSFWPRSLSVFYPMPIGGWPTKIVFISAVVFVLAWLAAWLARNQRVPILIGWGWFVITLLPVIGIIQVGSQSMADRYMYVPMIGLSITLLWGLPDRYVRLCWTSFVSVGVPATILLILTTQQVAIWQGSIPLFEHALLIEPRNNVTSHTALGLAYSEAGRMNEATAQLEQAVNLRPSGADHVGNLARHYIKDGRYTDAAELVTRALQTHKRNSGLWLHLGNAMKGRNESEKAIESYRKAAAFDPTSKELSEALNNLGLMLCTTNNAEGMKYIRQAIKANPENAQAHNSLGNALVRDGNLEKAMKCYLEAIRLADLPGAKQNLVYVRELIEQSRRQK